MIRKAIFKTAGMFDDRNPYARDYDLWKSIAEYMDGEMAIVGDSGLSNKKICFPWLDRSGKRSGITVHGGTGQHDRDIYRRSGGF